MNAIKNNWDLLIFFSVLIIGIFTGSCSLITNTDTVYVAGHTFLSDGTCSDIMVDSSLILPPNKFFGSCDEEPKIKQNNESKDNYISPWWLLLLLF